MAKLALRLVTRAVRFGIGSLILVLVTTSAASASFFAVDYRPIPPDALAGIVPDPTAAQTIEKNVRDGVDSVPNMLVLPRPLTVPPDFFVSSLMSKVSAGILLTVVVTKMPEGATKKTDVVAADAATLSTKLAAADFRKTLGTLFVPPSSALDTVSLVIPLHPVDDKAPNITNRLVATLAKRGVRAKPKLDFDFRGKKVEDILALCTNEAVTTIYGWDVEQERLSNPLGIYTYRADVALHQFGCTDPAQTKSVLGRSQRKLWLNPTGGVAALVALATLGGANPGLSPISTFVSSTTSAAFPSNSDDDFRNHVIQLAIDDAVDHLVPK